MPTKPHILFVILDTQRRDHLSLYGHTRDTAPQMAAFAQGATVFERAIAPAQWTIPAHGSLFTGLYPSAHGLTQAYQSMSGPFPHAWPRILQLDRFITPVGIFATNPAAWGLAWKTGLCKPRTFEIKFLIKLLAGGPTPPNASLGSKYAGDNKTVVGHRRSKQTGSLSPKVLVRALCPLKTQFLRLTFLELPNFVSRNQFPL